MRFDVGSPELITSIRTTDRKYCGIRAVGGGSEVYPIDKGNDLRVEFASAMKGALEAHPACTQFEIVTSHKILLGIETSPFQCIQLEEPRSVLSFTLIES